MIHLEGKNSSSVNMTGNVTSKGISTTRLHNNTITTTRKLPISWITHKQLNLASLCAARWTNLSITHLPALPIKLSLRFTPDQSSLKDLVGFGLEFIILGRRKLKNQAYLVWRGSGCFGTKGVSEGSQVSLIRASLNMASRP